MCVFIFVGIRKQDVVEILMEVLAPQEGDVSDECFFKNNSGAGKQFPGGPTCVFQGKEVPCLTQWLPIGSIASNILIDILATLDHLIVFDKTEG